VRTSSLIAVVVALAVGAAACKSSTSAPTTTTTVTRTTETFSGTVPVHGSAFNNFTVSATGLVEVTLTAASPPATIAMGVGVGTQTGTACTVLAGSSVATPAGSTVQLSGILSADALCVLVSDLGAQTSAVAYTVTVTHP
jgi:hypothetical protein